MKIKNYKLKIIFLGILLLAGFFRLYGINWDQNQHLHPDERFLTMVSTSIEWPYSIGEYFNTNSSPLNPHNKGFPFFVYGTFPVFLTKFVADSLNLGDYNNLTLIGRQLSALVDIGTVILVFLIAKSINQTLIHNSPHPPSYLKRGLGGVTSSDFGFRIFPFFAMLFYASSVLPIQLSHFYAVDTYLTFFITISFYLLMKIVNISKSKNILNTKYIILNTLLGISFGLALASKISAILFLPITLIIFFLISFKKAQADTNQKAKIFNFALSFFIFNFSFLISCYLTLRLTQPYLFASPNLFNVIPTPKVIENWNQLQSFDNPETLFPPGVQWITTKPYIFPLKNLVFWGLGLPLGVISILGVVCTILFFCHSGLSRIYKKSGFWSRSAPQNDNYIILFLILLWILLLFFYQGIQFAKPMRYFIPIYPFLAILSGYFIIQVFFFIQQKYQKSKIKDQNLAQNSKLSTLHWALIFALCALSLLPAISFLSIYSRPHSRVTASEWIYNNIPPGSTLANEYWDDPLPLYLSDKNAGNYQGIMLPLYDADTPEKWQKINADLQKVNYIILSSNRLYGSILTVPEKYPQTQKYYESLFDGSLGFQKIAEFSSRPNIPIPFINICLTPPLARYGIIAKDTQDCPFPGISFVDDYADESFTVYDHPKVLILKKIESVNYNQILGIDI